MLRKYHKEFRLKPPRRYKQKTIPPVFFDLGNMYGMLHDSSTDPFIESCDPEHENSGASNLPPDNIVYYYTTVSTFQKIIESGAMYASHILRLNDKEEFELGARIALKKLRNQDYNKKAGNKSNETSPEQELLPWDKEDTDEQAIDEEKERIDKIEKISRRMARTIRYISNDEIKKLSLTNPVNSEIDYAFPEVYNISFSTARDRLSQWHIYAQECGVSIGFDFNNADNSLALYQKVRVLKADPNNESQYIESNQKLAFRNQCKVPERVDYTSLQNEKGSGDSDLKPEDPSSTIREIFGRVPYYKNENFAQEEERRFIFRPYKQQQENECWQSRIGYRPANQSLVPYLEIYCGQNKGKALDPDKLKPGWPIVSLTVGPGHNQEQTFSALIHYLEYAPIKLCPLSLMHHYWQICLYYHDFLDYLKQAANYGDACLALLTKKDDEGEKASLEKFIAKVNSKYEYYNKIISFSPQNGQKLNIAENILLQCLEQDCLKTIYETINEKLQQNTLSDELHKVVAQHFDTYTDLSYISSQGIIVKKSVIPYIF